MANRKRIPPIASTRVIAMYVTGTVVGGLAAGIALVNAGEAFIRHDAFAFLCALIGAVGMVLLSAFNGFLILRSYSRPIRLGSSQPHG